MNLASLGLLTFGCFTEIADGKFPRPAGAILLGVAVVSWLGWRVWQNSSSRRSGAVLWGMALAGGALVPFAPVAMVFPAVAALSLAMRWSPRTVALLAIAGWVAIVAAVEGTGAGFGLAFSGLAAIFAGSLMGITRRQSVAMAEQAAKVELETARTEIERTRAELLTERNHLARELHDVLAHTLAALSLQLEAFGTVIDGEPQTSPAIRDQLARTRQLVHEGLNEARGAVLALRDDVRPLADQLAVMCAQHRADFTVDGSPQFISVPTVNALYRMTQEALTNVMKHAAGAPTAVRLTYEDDLVSVTVDNGAGSGSSPLASSGAGYGLQGITERVGALGGSVEAGPTPDGWRVRAAVPTVSDSAISSEGP
jgi:signal transduction histidine kinase